MRVLLFALICVISFCYSTNRFLLMPIQDQLIDYYNINAVDYNLTTSIYTWPNLITLLLAGLLIDKIGLYRTLCISWWFSILGAALTTISATSTSISFLMLCFGRGIIGIGNEALNICMRVWIINTFNKNEFGLAMSVYSASVGFWSGINTVFVYQVYAFFDSIQIAFAIPLILYPILSFPLFMYIRCNANNSNKSNESYETNQETESTKLITPTSTIKQKIARKQTIDWNIYALKQFSCRYWILIIVGCLFAINTTSLNNILVSFLYHMYGYTYSLSASLSTMKTLVGGVFAITAGIITDKYGIKCKLLIFVTISLGCAHYLFGWVHINLVFTCFSLVLYGVSGVFRTVLFCSIPILVNTNIIGTAFGICDSLRFISMGAGYLIVGALTNEEDGNTKYIKVQYFEVCLAMVTFVFICILWRLDSINGYKLDKPHKIISVVSDESESEGEIMDKEPTEIELDFTMSLQHSIANHCQT